MSEYDYFLEGELYDNSINDDCHITGHVFLPALHPTQQQVAAAPRHRMSRCGRRWGKTELKVSDILEAMIDIPGLYWWVGTEWGNAGMQRAERLFIYWFRKLWMAYEGVPWVPDDRFYNRSRRVMKHWNGSELWFRTAANPEAARGEEVKGVVLDECAHMEPEIYYEAIRPTVLKSRGWIAMISTPNGMNWWFDHWMATQSNPDWSHFHFSTYDNPFIPPEEIDAMKEEMTEEQFRQEIMAEFVETGSGVFNRLERIIDKDLTIPGAPRENGIYVFGIDFARSRDYSVIAVWDVERKALCHYARVNNMPSPEQVRWIKRTYERWRPVTMICEWNGLGIPMIDDLRRLNLPAQKFITTQQTKMEIIENLAFDVDNALVVFPNCPTLIHEFRAFRKEKQPSGSIKYAAPETGFDDIVMAACIGYTAARKFGSPIVY